MAAQLLSSKGFDKVYNMSGGIHAWEGRKAAGPQELNLDLITGEETAAEIAAIGYQMEESLGQFYRSAIGRTKDPDLVDLLTKLAQIEDKHKSFLAALAPQPFEPAHSKTPHLENVLEGGFNSETLIENNENFLDSLSDVLDLALMLETQAMDLYVRFARKSRDDSARKMLYKIAKEEKAHLAALGKLYDAKI